jgi:hypothetical protein
MRTAIAFTLLAVLLLPATPVAAQYTSLVLSSEPSYWNCTLTDAGQQLRTVYVLVDQTSETMGVQFRVTQSYDCTLVYLQNQPGGIWNAGDIETGLTVCFDECVSGSPPQVVTTIQYFGLGTSATCSQLVLEPPPWATQILSVSCDGTVHPGNGFPLYINNDGSCGCYVASEQTATKSKTVAPTDEDNFCYVVSTEASTWGSIKALYR